MNIEPVHCPACRAIVNVPPDADRVTCEYCGTTSLIELSQGQVTLKLSQELAGLRQTLQDSGVQTAESVRTSAEDTQKEIQRMRLGHELSIVDMRLANLQSEVRLLQRDTDKKKSKTLKNQLAELEKQEKALIEQRAYIQKSLVALDPGQSDLLIGSNSSAAQINSNNKNSVLGCLGWTTLWFIIFTLISGLFAQALGEFGIVLGVILSIALIYYIQRRRKRKAGVT